MDAEALTLWWDMRTRWHCLDESAPDWTARCGLQVTVRPNLIASTPESLYPPNPCTACQTAVAFDDAEEETVEDAKARGYVLFDYEASG